MAPILRCRCSHHRALRVALFRLSRLLTLLDLGYHAFEGFTNVLVVFGGNLDEATSQLFGEFLAIGGRDLSLFGSQIGFVGHDHDGNSLSTQVVEDLVLYDADHLETLLGCDRVHNHITVNADEVLAVQYCVLILSGCIDDLHAKVLIPVLDHFAEGVLDGRVVRVDKVPIDILNCEG